MLSTALRLESYFDPQSVCLLPLVFESDAQLTLWPSRQFDSPGTELLLRRVSSVEQWAREVCMCGEGGADRRGRKVLRCLQSSSGSRSSSSSSSSPVRSQSTCRSERRTAWRSASPACRSSSAPRCPVGNTDLRFVELRLFRVNKLIWIWFVVAHLSAALS